VVVHVSAPKVGPTSNWIIAEAVAACFSAFLLAATLLVASRYGHRADCRVEGETFQRRDGLGMSVRVEIRSRGIRRMKVAQAPQRKPAVEVVEVLSQTDSYRNSRNWSSDEVIRETNDTLDPGETLSGSRLFYLGEPTPETVGWTVQFSFQVRRKFKPKKDGYWYWEEKVFVPRTSP
jgi:hypothetical protein